MKRGLALLAVLPLVAACSGSHSRTVKNHLIVLDHSIGGVSLLERRAEVERSLGKGVLKGHTSRHSHTTYVGGKLDVWYALNRAFIIKTESPVFRTSSGVGVGSSATSLHTLRGLDCFGGSDQCQHGYSGMNKPGTTFEVGRNGRVSWIAMTFGH